MQTPTAQVEWTVPSAAERCRILRHSLAARGVADARLDAVWPGSGAGDRDPETLDAWIQTYTDLRCLLLELERDRERQQAAVAGYVADSLANAPQPVQLTIGAHAVHPKSYHTLRWLDMLDRAVRDVAAAAAALVAGDTAPEDLEAFALAPLLESTAVRLWAWILLTPGSGLPFDEDAGTPTPPAWTMTLAPEDVITIARAHIEVHVARLRVIADAFPGEETTETRLSLAGFLGSSAAELGVRPAELLRTWTLGEAFASAVTASQAAREARKAAEAKAKAAA